LLGKLLSLCSRRFVIGGLLVQAIISALYLIILFLINHFLQPEKGVFTTNAWRYVFVADFEVISYQGTMRFDKRENLETDTVPAINYTAC
jgi:hypothetical protein